MNDYANQPLKNLEYQSASRTKVGTDLMSQPNTNLYS